MDKKRPHGPMVPITDADIKNLKFIRDAAKTYEKMAEWTGFSATGLSRWMNGGEFEMEWRKSIQIKIKKVARDLNPKPEPVMAASRMPVFSGEDPLRRAYSLARKHGHPGDKGTQSMVLQEIADILAHKLLEN